MDDPPSPELKRGREETIQGLERLKAEASKKKYSAAWFEYCNESNEKKPTSKKPTYSELKAYFAKLDSQIEKIKSGK